jgi:hypothetical protein
MALCPLAATVLTKEGLLKSKQLELCVYCVLDWVYLTDNDSVSRSSGAKRDPTDPLSAVAFGVYDTVGDILLGLVQGPVELGKQVAPMMKQYEAKQQNDSSAPKGHELLFEADERRHSIPRRPVGSRSASASTQSIPHDEAYGHYEPAKALEVDHTRDDVSVTSKTSEGKGKFALEAAGPVAKGTGMGLGRIVGAGFKAPMTFTHGITRGFHNVPKLYGEEVREYENVVDIKSGLAVAGKVDTLVSANDVLPSS